MNAVQKRFLMFLVGCIGARGLLVYLAAVASDAWLRVMAVGAAAISAGFLIIYAGGWRKTGPETGGAPIWWDMLRPVHALLYGMFAYHAWNGNRALAWRILLVDVALGLASFLGYHAGRGNLDRL